MNSSRRSFLLNIPLVLLATTPLLSSCTSKNNFNSINVTYLRESLAKLITNLDQEIKLAKKLNSADSNTLTLNTLIASREKHRKALLKIYQKTTDQAYSKDKNELVKQELNLNTSIKNSLELTKKLAFKFENTTRLVLISICGDLNIIGTSLNYE